MTWTAAIEDYKSYLKLEKSLAKNTIENYTRDLQKLVGFTAAEPLKISKNEVEEFLYQYAKLGFSERSQARLISSLKSFFNYLQLEEWREGNPAELLESPKLGLKLPDVLSTKEIDILISQIDLSKPEGERNRAIIETLYGCGLRVSELTNLKISDLFFKENFIKVIGKGNKQRLIPISDYTIKYINLYKDHVRVHQRIKPEYEDFLFLNRWGRSLTRVMIFTIIKDLKTKAGFTKSVSPHSFRHSFATHLLKNGADLRSIQLMLGHESITTTEIYAHLDDTSLRNAILNHHPRNQS